jgi:Fe-S cluster assembly protein SufD
MVSVKEELSTYQTEFLQRERELMELSPSWLMPVRKAAIARFGELGFPTTRDEEWRFTNVGPIANQTFTPAGDYPPSVTPEQVQPFLLNQDDAVRLVFLNGRYSLDLSDVSRLPNGVLVEPLAVSLERRPDQLQPHLTRYADFHDCPFAALNTALMGDGAFVRIEPGRVLDRPIQVLFVSTAPDEPLAVHPRVLIVADRDSQATVIETYAGLDESVYFANSVTELHVGVNARLDHYRLQLDSPNAYHVSTFGAWQDRDSTLRAGTYTFGGALVRNNVSPVLGAEGTYCSLNGLYVLQGRQHVDNHLRVDHAKPHGDSREYYKGILADEARAVFTGRIVVRKDAQKTDAKQTNMNLLLSEHAQVNSRPQLEIFADDVKCTHGATIGQLDEDAIFYLRARGIAREAARGIMTHAFAGEVLDEIRIEPLRAALETRLYDRLPHGEPIRKG